jgi:threonine-phosphate decarboxylase
MESGLTAPALKTRLLAERIAIRDCNSFRGLGPAFIRLAVRRPEEHQVLLGALERCL